MTFATYNHYGTLFPRLQDKLQNMLHRVTPAYSLQSLQVQNNCETSKLQRRHVTGCNLPATCLATPLRDKLQEKLHRITLDLGAVYTIEVWLIKLLLHQSLFNVDQL